MAKDSRDLEEAQRRSDAQYRAVVNHAAEAIVVAQDGLVVFANPRAAEITGYAQHEMPSMMLQDLLCPDDLPLVAERTRQRAEGTLSDPYSYFRIVRKDGTLRSVQSCPVTIEWEGRPASLAFIADLSEKQAAEQAVRRSEERLRLVVDNVGEGILVGVDDGRIVFANTRAAAMSGRTVEELMQMGLRELIHPDDYEPTIARAVARLQGQTVERYAEYRALHKDGSEIWVRSSPVIIDWNGRPAVLTFLVDLTEQRANEAALRRSEQRYREVVEHVTEGIVVAQDAHIVFANPKAAVMSGRAVEELVGLPFSAVIHPEDLAEAAARDQRRLRGEQIDRFTTYRALHKDGHSFWVQSSPVTIDWEGRPATLTFLIDLTERRAAEEALRRSEHRYREVVENGSDGIFVVDGPDFVFANNRFQQLSGYTYDELIGKEVFDLVVPEDIPVLMERYRQRDPTDTNPEASLDWRLRHKDGRAVWVRSRAVQIHWDGKPVSLAFISDITAARTVEQALRTSEERYRLVVEHVEEGIIVVQDGVLKLCNPSTVIIVGYPIEDLVGHSITHFIHPEDLPKVLTNYQARLRGEPQGARYDFRVITKDGRTVWVELGAVLFEWEGRPATLSFLIDITVRKQAEEATRIALEQQQELNYLKTRFLSMTSHEFRTPLATILSSTELLRYYGDRLPGEEKTELYSTIESAVKRMTQLLEDVLVIGKHDSGAERLVRAPLDVTEYCRALCAEVVLAEEALGRTGREVDLSFEGDCGYAQLDANQLRHVLVNLLSNAIKYTPAGRQVSFHVSGDAGAIVFEVADQGIGIAEEDRAHLFELFFRARNVGNIAGTGLGLAIVKRAVDLHCGDIAVSSALGEGTRFTVRLPRGEFPP